MMESQALGCYRFRGPSLSYFKKLDKITQFTWFITKRQPYFWWLAWKLFWLNYSNHCYLLWVVKNELFCRNAYVSKLLYEIWHFRQNNLSKDVPHTVRICSIFTMMLSEKNGYLEFWQGNNNVTDIL